MKANRITGAVVMQRVWALLLAAALCLGLMPTMAWAEEEVDGSTFSVALTVVDTSDPANGIIKNVKIDKMTSDKTVADLLVAAGFKEGTEAESRADATGMTYFVSNNAPYFRGLGYDAVTGNYWSTIFDGGSDPDGWKKAVLDAKLTAQGHYQYIYGTDFTFTYSDESSEFPVQLTVVDTSDPANGIIKNVKIDKMTSDKTVADLLVAAGFKEGTEAESRADATGMTYFVSNNAPYFRGLGYDAVTGNYWSTIFDGGSDPDGWKKAVLDAKLTAQGHYQYIYGTDFTFTYSDDIPQLVLDAINNPLPIVDEPVVPEVPNKPVVPEPPTYEAKSFDETAYKTLFAAIADSYAGASDEWKALGLAAIGRAASADTAMLLANAQAAALQPDTTNLQRFIIPLTALGKTAEATTLVDAMATSAVSTNFVNGQAFALLSYESGNYGVPADALKTKQDLISNLIAAALPEGGWSWGGNKPEADMTAMVLTALAPYVSQDATVKTAVDKGLEVLHSLQQEDGGFGAIGVNVETATNANSTAAVVIALSALGVDPATSWATQSGATPLSALLSQAAADLTSFVYSGKVNDLATQQGFLALASYQGFKNTKAAYNIYTQAQAGQAALPGLAKQEEKKQQEETIDNKVLPGADKKPLAQTGDDTLPFTAGVTAAALCALAAGVAATRRLRSGHESSLRR